MTLEEIEKKKSGRIADFPNEVIRKMLERQVEQGNYENINVFINSAMKDKKDGGFSWEDTEEGFSFWNNVILNEKFDVFFEKYPKKEYPKVMEVSNLPNFPVCYTHKQVVFMEKNGKYLAWDAETLEEAEYTNVMHEWKYARDIKEGPNIEIKVFINEEEVESFKASEEFIEKMKNLKNY